MAATRSPPGGLQPPRAGARRRGPGGDRRRLQRRRHLHHPAGVLRGKDGIRQAFTKLLSEIPQATWDLKSTIYEDDILFLEWDAEGGGNRIQDAVDTFVFRDGLIRVQTVRYTLQPAR
jgi:predicted SnoaL-like aldol condensation-catalyzing enzyme